MALLQQYYSEKSNQPRVSVNLNQMNMGRNDSFAYNYLIKLEINVPSTDLQSTNKGEFWIPVLQPPGLPQPHLFIVAALFQFTLSACPSELEADVLTSGAKLLDSSSLWTLHTKCKHFLPFGQTLAQETFFPMLTAGSLNKSSVSRRVGERKS